MNVRTTDTSIVNDDEALTALAERIVLIKEKLKGRITPFERKKLKAELEQLEKDSIAKTISDMSDSIEKDVEGTSILQELQKLKQGQASNEPVDDYAEDPLMQDGEFAKIKHSSVTTENVGFTISTPDKFNPKMVKNRDLDLYKRAQTYKCCSCGESTDKQSELFSIGYSSVYAGYNYYFPICNQCLDKMYELLLSNLLDCKLAYKRICMLFDIYYCDELVEMTESTSLPLKKMTTYIRNSHLNKFSSKTYANTLCEEIQKENELNDKYQILLNENENLKERIKDSKRSELYSGDGADGDDGSEIIELWGEGLEPEDYIYLQKKYESWLKGIDECEDHATEVLYQQLSMIQWRIWKANLDPNAKATDVTALSKQLNDSLSALNLKPVQKTVTGINGNEQTLGAMIAKWEETDPVPESQPSGIVKYITVWFFGHICKVLGLKNTWALQCEQEVGKYSADTPQFFEEDEQMGSFDDIFGGGKP